MAVYVLKNFPPLASLPLSSREVMREVGLLARERIYRRTIAGVDMHGEAFQPYSAAYTKAKAEAVGSTGVTLQLSGAMLNALQVLTITDDTVEIGFKG